MASRKNKKTEEQEDCSPCKVGAAANALLDAYCRDECKSNDDNCMVNCDNWLDKMLDDNMSLNDLAKKLNVPQEDLDFFEEEGVNVDAGIRDLLHKEDK